MSDAHIASFMNDFGLADLVHWHLSGEEPHTSTNVSDIRQGRCSTAVVRRCSAGVQDDGEFMFNLASLRNLMPEEGVEPSRGCPHGILSPARLPIPPLGLG